MSLLVKLAFDNLKPILLKNKNGQVFLMDEGAKRADEKLDEVSTVFNDSLFRNTISQTMF